MVSGPLDNCLEAFVLWFGTFSFSLEFISDVIVAQGKSVGILRAAVYHGQHLMLMVHRKTFQSIKEWQIMHQETLWPIQGKQRIRKTFHPFAIESGIFPGQRPQLR